MMYPQLSLHEKSKLVDEEIEILKDMLILSDRRKADTAKFRMIMMSDKFQTLYDVQHATRALKEETVTLKQFFKQNL